jgi:SAM-dependent methyltransferase
LVTTTADPDPVVEMKQRARAMWATGDYPTVALTIREVSDRIVRQVGIRPGEDVLDVACGNGNTTIPAAQAGGRVTGVDLTPELLQAGRVAAAAAGVQIDWREGDAEALPFEDAQFDVVLSSFGCMFAPRHEVVAAEIARVLRPGGRLGLCAWTPEGTIGRFFELMSKHLPPPPAFASPPPRWGDPDHVRRLFVGSGIALQFDRAIVEMRFDSVPEMVSFYETNFGPVIAARELLAPTGGWLPLREELAGYLTRETIPDRGGVVWPCEYLMVTGHKAEG